MVDDILVFLFTKLTIYDTINREHTLCLTALFITEHRAARPNNYTMRR